MKETADKGPCYMDYNGGENILALMKARERTV